MAQTQDPVAAEIAKPKVVKIKRFQIGLNVIVQVVILTVIVLFVNYVSFRHFKRWDFSRSQKFALSSQTTTLLKSLTKPVKAIVFFNGEAGSNQIYPDTLSLLKEYEYASDRKFNVEIVDPYRNITRAKDLQTQYKFGANENILILDYQGRNKFINAPDMVEMDPGNPMLGQPGEIKSFKGESAVTSALLELIEEKQKKVYLVAGHGEPDVNAAEITAFREYVKRQNIKMETLKLGDVDSIPEDTTALIVFGPRTDYSELEIKRLGDFWEKKGRLILLLNVERKTPRINQWLDSVGITPRGDHVLKTGTVLSQNEDGSVGLKNGIILTATVSVVPTSKDITRDLAGVGLQLLGSTESLYIKKEQEQIQKQRFTTILESGEGFWGDNKFVRGEEKPVFFDPQKDTQGPVVVAVAVEKGAIADPHVKVETGRMVVFGNADFLTDKGLQVAGDTGLDLVLNSVNWLLNRENMVGGIPPKEKKNTSLALDEKQLRNLALSLMFGIPLVIAFFGFATWMSRRS
jgi:hypothetical protein